MSGVSPWLFVVIPSDRREPRNLAVMPLP